MRLESSCKAAHLSIENFLRDTFKSGKDNVVMLQIWLSSICGCTRKLRVLLASAVASTVALLQEEMDGRINS